jgi:hypothetical protein
VEVEGSLSESDPDQSMKPCQKKQTKSEKPGGLLQVVYEAFISIPSIIIIIVIIIITIIT